MIAECLLAPPAATDLAADFCLEPNGGDVDPCRLGAMVACPVDALTAKTRPVGTAGGGLVLPTLETPAIAPYYQNPTATIWQGDCRTWLPLIPASSVDFVLTDPPYPEIDRAYGRLSETDWMALMQAVVGELRRILTPTGSAVIILQPNSAHVGQMRLWLWRFLLWAAETWNLVQDAYWWNITTIPTAGASREHGLMRGSLKYCIWLGPPNCYRNQDQVLWQESDNNLAGRLADRSSNDLKYGPFGGNKRQARLTKTAGDRGGVTPYNVLPIANSNSQSSAGAKGHGAGTPFDLCYWWVRYCCPPGGTVADPFLGSGTVADAAKAWGARFVGGDQSAAYCAMATVNAQQPLLTPPAIRLVEAPDTWMRPGLPL